MGHCVPISHEQILKFLHTELRIHCTGFLCNLFFGFFQVHVGVGIVGTGQMRFLLSIQQYGHQYCNREAEGTHDRSTFSAAGTPKQKQISTVTWNSEDNFLVLGLETSVLGLEGQVLGLGLDTKSLVLSLKFAFVWVSQLRWKLSSHVFLLLLYCSTGAHTIYTKLHWFWPSCMICRWTKFAACPCTTNFVPYCSAFFAP